MQFWFCISQTISPIAKWDLVIKSKCNLTFATKNDFFETQVVELCFVAFVLDKKYGSCWLKFVLLKINQKLRLKNKIAPQMTKKLKAQYD